MQTNNESPKHLLTGGHMQHATCNLQLFTVRDAAKLLDMSEHAIRRLIKQRKLPVVRIGQRLMLTANGIAQLIKKSTYPAVQERIPGTDICFRY
jgi:excisionase family DNA binding protein